MDLPPHFPVFEPEPDFQHGSSQMTGRQPGTEHVQQAVEDENQGLAGMDGVIEIDGLTERFRRPVEFQKPAGFS